MTGQSETSFHLPLPRVHALRDVAFVTFLLAVIGAFLASSV
jgi:hypothetical protein